MHSSISFQFYFFTTVKTLRECKVDSSETSVQNYYEQIEEEATKIFKITTQIKKKVHFWFNGLNITNRLPRHKEIPLQNTRTLIMDADRRLY